MVGNVTTLDRADRSDVIELLARLGYATKGVLYLVIGGLATLYAFVAGGRLTDGTGAAKTVQALPLGQALLWIAACGLGGYALWRFTQAALHLTRGAQDGRRIASALGFTVSGALHVALAIAAVQMATANGGGGDAKRTYLARLMELPGGELLVVLIGLAVIGFAMYEGFSAYRAKFAEDLKRAEMSAAEETWSLRVGRMGLAARGVVFAIIGYFLCRAGASGSSAQVTGVEGALRAIASESYGTILLAIVALGLVAYAVHQFFSAKYRRIDARMPI